jgi:hypothetical protein
MQTYRKEEWVGVVFTVVGNGWRGDGIEPATRSKGGGGKELEGDVWYVHAVDERAKSSRQRRLL